MAANTAGVKAGKAFILIEAVDKTAFVMKRIGMKMQAFGARMQSMGADMVRKSVAALLPAMASTRVFVGYDDAMRKVEARSRGTADEMSQLREQAKLLGRTTSFTAGQVGELQAKVAQKGFKRSGIKEMTGDILNLARAAGEGDLGDTVLAADLLTGALRAFKAEAKDSGHFADVFTAAVNNSNFNLQGLLDTFKNAAPIAKKYNVSLEDTVSTLAAMTNLNIDPASAGTGFRNLLLKTSNKKARDQFNKNLKSMTGNTIDFVDKSGNLRSIPKILFAIGEATKSMGTADKGKLLSDLFGLRAIIPALAVSDGANDFQELSNILSDVDGVAAKTAKTMDAGLGGSFRMTLSALEGLAISIGEAVDGPLSGFLDWVIKISGSLTEWVENNRGLVAGVTAAIAGVAGLGLGLVVLGMVVSSVGTLLVAAGSILGVVTKGLVLATGAVKILGGAVLGFLVSPWGLAVLAIAAVVGAVLAVNSTLRGKLMGTIRSVGSFVIGHFRAMWDTVKATLGGIMEALRKGDFKAAFAIGIGGAKILWLQFMDLLTSTWENTTSGFLGPLSQATTGAREVWSSFIGFLGDSWQAGIGFLESAFTSDFFQGVVQTLQSMWDGFIGFFTSSSDGAIENVTQKMIKMQQTLANSILDLASEDGLIGDILDKVLGVDVSAERKRAIELERKRLALLAQQGLEATPQTDAYTQAREDMNKEFDQRIEDASNENHAKSIDKAGKDRKAEIERQRKELDAAIAALNPETTAEELGEQIKKNGEQTEDAAGDLAAGIDTTSRGLTSSRALEQGTIEAAQQFQKNQANASKTDGLLKEAEAQNEKLAEQNRTLEKIDEDLMTLNDKLGVV